MSKETAIQRINKIVVAAMHLIKEAGGEMRVKDIRQLLPQRFDFTERELSATKNGNIRWLTYLGFYSLGSTKAGFLIKNKGTWIITPDGEAALQKGDDYYIETAHSAYLKWEGTRNTPNDVEDVCDRDASASINLVDIQADAEESIRNYIASKNPYEFQDLVAALLRAMGYYTPFIAPKGRDGGIDIIAYRDPLGTIPPTLKVQVKHYPSSTISVDIVRSLVGVLTKEDECGLIVTSGKFTSEAIREARHSHRRIRLIDIDEFLTLWEIYYDKMPQGDKDLLPLISIHFLKPLET